MMIQRLFNPEVSLEHRAYQIANAFITRLLCKPLSLVHVVEYPKSGGSWIRNMIRSYQGSRLFTGEGLIHRGDTVLVHRLYASHYCRPIIVVRDPRDIYVSFYYYETQYENRGKSLEIDKYYKRDPDKSLREDFAAYLEKKLLYPTHPWFFFSKFLDSWLNRPYICVVRYEDCLSDAEAQLVRILRFIDQPVDLELVRSTVEAANFKNITREKYGVSRKPAEANNLKFHRKGVAGDW
ncbi:MAG TPA: hypothetical protein ENI62_12740, partial [Gammaproteobacteria bacterium]|nr:hypothetical protein [Gammaproteobacteria bacterium]